MKWFVRFAVGLVLINAVILGATTSVLAAPAFPPTNAAALVAQAGAEAGAELPGVLESLYQLLLAAVMGGAWVFVLESFAAWRNWQPEARGLPEWLKPGAVLLLTGCSIFALAAGREFMIVNYPNLAPWLQVSVLAVAAWLVSQVLYRWQKTQSVISSQ